MFLVSSVSTDGHLVNIPSGCLEDPVALWDAGFVVAVVLVAGAPLVLAGAVRQVVEPIACVAGGIRKRGEA